MINQCGNEIDEDSSHLMETCDKLTNIFNHDRHSISSCMGHNRNNKKTLFFNFTLSMYIEYLMKNILIIHENIISKKSI